MNVSIARQDLINLCKGVSKTPDISNHKFKQAFEIRPFINGPDYRLSEQWVEKSTDEELFEFYKYHSSTIKLL